MAWRTTLPATTINKRGGKISDQGSVLFTYDKKGKIWVPTAIDEETLLDAAIEADTDDNMLHLSALSFVCDLLWILTNKIGSIVDAIEELDGVDSVEHNMSN